MKIFYFETKLCVMFRQVFGKTLGQRGDQSTFFSNRPHFIFFEKVIYLFFDGSGFYNRVYQTSRANYELDDVVFWFFYFILGWCRG